MMKKMLVFSSVDKTFCYEYLQSPVKQNLYCCYGCRKMGEKVYAKTDGNENLFIQGKNHVCEKLPYSPEKYFDLQIVKKPNYEILENTNTKYGKVLIIFNPNNRNQCHEYWREKRTNAFRCCGCGTKAVATNISMKNEYVEIMNNHECPFRSYDPEKFYKFNKIVLAPNFELRNEMKFGKSKLILIIFDETDKSKCYIYAFYSSKKRYKCKNCVKQGLVVSAKLHQNSDGENYIVRSNTQHVCESVKYVSNDEIILRPPDFKFIEETVNGVAKLFIFDLNKKKFCYTFSPVGKTGYRYRCLGCQNTVLKKSGKNAVKSNVDAYLCKEENGEYFVQMKNQNHLCQPKKYEAEKYVINESKIVDKFFLYRNTACSDSVNVAIIHSTDSTLCYPFLFDKNSHIFQCSNCMKLKKSYKIPLPKIDENGKEYFIHDQEKHNCEPIKISLIQTSQFQTLKRNELTFKDKPKIDESRIVKLPDIEFRPSKYGNAEGKLVIFDKSDKTLCYEYFFDNHKKLFVCSKCKKKKHLVNAKVHFDEEKNEKFVEISKNEHICEPVKDEYENKIINASDFLVINPNDELNPAKIIVFTSESKEFYYEFRYCASERCFHCCECKKRYKYVGVKLMTKENGEEFLMKMKNEHVCAPTKDYLNSYK